MADKCPLGEDCDLTLAYMMGAEKAKDSIVVLRRENERLRAALEGIADLPPGYADMRQDDLVVILANKARAVLEGSK